MDIYLRIPEDIWESEKADGSKPKVKISTDSNMLSGDSENYQTGPALGISRQNRGQK